MRINSSRLIHPRVIQTAGMACLILCDVILPARAYGQQGILDEPADSVEQQFNFSSSEVFSEGFEVVGVSPLVRDGSGGTDPDKFSITENSLSADVKSESGLSGNNFSVDVLALIHAQHILNAGERAATHPRLGRLGELLGGNAIVRNGAIEVAFSDHLLEFEIDGRQMKVVRVEDGVEREVKKFDRNLAESLLQIEAKVNQRMADLRQKLADIEQADQSSANSQRTGIPGAGPVPGAEGRSVIEKARAGKKADQPFQNGFGVFVPGLVPGTTTGDAVEEQPLDDFLARFGTSERELLNAAWFADASGRGLLEEEFYPDGSPEFDLDGAAFFADASRYEGPIERNDEEPGQASKSETDTDRIFRSADSFSPFGALGLDLLEKIAGGDISGDAQEATQHIGSAYGSRLERKALTKLQQFQEELVAITENQPEISKLAANVSGKLKPIGQPKDVSDVAANLSGLAKFGATMEFFQLTTRDSGTTGRDAIQKFVEQDNDPESQRVADVLADILEFAEESSIVADAVESSFGDDGTNARNGRLSLSQAIFDHMVKNEKEAVRVFSEGGALGRLFGSPPPNAPPEYTRALNQQVGYVASQYDSLPDDLQQRFNQQLSVLAGTNPLAAELLRQLIARSGAKLSSVESPSETTVSLTSLQPSSR